MGSLLSSLLSSLGRRRSANKCRAAAAVRNPSPHSISTKVSAREDDKEVKKGCAAAKKELETCPICLCEINDGRVVKLKCTHKYHLDCLKGQINSGKASKSGRITFNHLKCALCRTDIQWAGYIDYNFRRVFNTHKELREQAFNVCYEQYKVDDIKGLKNIEILSKEAKRDEILRVMATYQCFECGDTFCGGKAECDAQSDKAKKAKCRECSFAGARSSLKCKKHGVKYAIFKCDCCCSIATYDCSGNHYCNTCHSKIDKKTVGRPKCRGREGDNCPLGVPHPPNQVRNHDIQKNGFVVGCTKCLGIHAHCTMSAVSASTRARFGEKGVLALNV